MKPNTSHEVEDAVFLGVAFIVLGIVKVIYLTVFCYKGQCLINFSLIKRPLVEQCLQHSFGVKSNNKADTNDLQRLNRLILMQLLGIDCS